MVPMSHAQQLARVDTAPVLSLEAAAMEYLVIFLLLFAVLAAAWFYLQRAKARDAGPASPSDDTPADDTRS